MSESEDEQEYVVEAVLRAKVVKKVKGKLTWNYYVKWKDYGQEFNTWEPEQSFEGSEHFINTFWENADLRGKDKSDANQFVRRDEVGLIVPGSRRKPRRKSEGDIPPPAEPDESEQDAVEEPVKRGRSSKAPKTYKPNRRKSMPEKPKPVASSSNKRKFEPSSSSDEEPVPLTKVGPPKKRVKRKIGNQLQPKSVDKPANKSVDDPPHQDPEITAADENRSPAAEPGAISVDDLFSSPALPREAPRSSGVFSVLAVDSGSEHGNNSDGGSHHSETPLPASRRLPAHRERATNPRIKMMEEPGVDETMKDAISIKTRIVSRTTTTTTTISKKPSSSNVHPLSSHAKPGPGRSSQGLLSTGIPDQDTPNNFTGPSGTGNTEVSSSLKQLVEEAANEVDAAGLADFEEDAMQVENNVEKTTTETTLPENRVIKTPSLGEGGRTKSWPKFGQASIFGLLGIGSSSKTTQDTFPLNLDSAVSVSVILKDIHPASKLQVPDLNTIIGQVPHPPGKFYKPESGAILLGSLKTGGPSARLSLEPNADEKTANHFSRFRARLENGDIFVTMAGQTLLTIVSSQNQDLCDKLGIPETLKGLVSEVVMSPVVIENSSAYCDAASTLVDSSRWL